MTIVEISATLTHSRWNQLPASQRRGNPALGSAELFRETAEGPRWSPVKVVYRWALFELGRAVATSNAIDAADGAGDTQLISRVLLRHADGDWGHLAPEDLALNDHALVDGGRLLSVYPTADGRLTLWVITEADRSSTTVLLPEDY